MAEFDASSAVTEAEATFSVAACSNPGRTREANEDTCLLWDLLAREPLGDGGTRTVPLRAGGLLLAVCDGMGGAVGGEVASSLAASTLSEHARDGFDEKLMEDPEAFLEWLSRAIRDAGDRIYARTQADPELAGMGSTVTAAGILPAFMVVAHVGDSRLYHVRNDHIRQLTVDHSFVGELVATGRISPEQARRHAQRNLLLQAVGTHRSLDVDRVAIPLEPGDRVLLCSDGLTDLVPDPRIERVLTGFDPPEDQALRLVEAANEGGGFDNISVIVAHVS